MHTQAQVTSANEIFNNTSTTAPLLLQTNGNYSIVNTGRDAGEEVVIEEGTGVETARY